MSAQSLRHLNYLIAEPVAAAAVYRGGVLFQIPQAVRFAIHKLIVADQRRGTPDGLKSTKDRLHFRLKYCRKTVRTNSGKLLNWP
jgi:hypothetical protein